MIRWLSTLTVLGFSIGSCIADTIELVNGSTIKGELVGRSDGYVAIARIEGRAAIERRVRAEEIHSIQFSDAFSTQEAIDASRAGNPSRALSLLEPLVKRRSAYIDLLQSSDQDLFAMALQAYLASGREADCLEQAKLWLPKIADSRLREAIQTLQIEAAWQLGRAEEAAFYATRWIDDEKDAQTSALAWYILAANSLEANDPERALWTALNPIVFSRPKQSRYLEHAYEIAIAAAIQLGRIEYAQTLYRDMKERSLVWPIDSKRSHIVQELENQLSPSSLSPPSNSHSTLRASDTLEKLIGNP